MELPSVYEYKGWTIRYHLYKKSNAVGDNGRHLPDVVFVHGTPWSSAVFRPIIEALQSKDFGSILVYDLPGYGQSQEYAPPEGSAATHGDFDGDTSVRFQADALAALLHEAKLSGKTEPSAAVIAHDIAGAIVLRAHLIHDVEFASMMLLDTNVVLPWGDGFYKLARSDPHTFLKLPPPVFEAVVRGVIQSASHDPRALQNGWEDILAEPWIGNSSAHETEARQRSFIRQIAQANDQDVAEMLEQNLYEKVRCKVKVVWGEQDQWIPRTKMEELVTRFKGTVAEFITIPRAGHLVMIDQPERFAVEVYDWLTRS